MTVAVDGAVKQTSISSCKYSASSPKPVCTEISSTPAEQPSGGPIKKKKMTEAIAEMKAYMGSVKELVGLYVPPQSAKIDASMQKGGVSTAPNPSAGTVSLVISNYELPGDKYTIVVGMTDSQLRNVNIDSYLNEPSSVVALAVTYAALKDGTHYAEKTVLNATAKKIVVTITTTNYSVAM